MYYINNINALYEEDSESDCLRGKYINNIVEVVGELYAPQFRFNSGYTYCFCNLPASCAERTTYRLR